MDTNPLQEIGEAFATLEKNLLKLRHTNNFVEVTEDYKKMKELGLWITLASQASQPTKNFGKVEKFERKNTKFGSNKKNK